MTTNKIENKKYLEGIWTPWAKVLCPQCHGNRNMSKEDYENYCTYIELNEESGVTTCNTCGKEIQLDISVANENNMVNKLKELKIDSYMCQSGGMCSCCEIAKKDDEGYYWITFNTCGENEFLIGSYDNDGDYLGDGRDFYCDTKEEMIEYVLSLKDVKKL